jgi:Zn-dependent membrane protease YugP
MWLGDPINFLSVLPGLVLALWARFKVRAAYAEGSKQTSRSGLSGAAAAARVLEAGAVTGVSVVPVSGPLADYYDSRGKVLRLSHAVYSGRSLTAIGVAAHEAGHALQHARGDLRLLARRFLVPAATLGSQICWMLVAASMLLGMLELFFLADFLFSVNVALQLVNTPLERDAGRRALEALRAAAVVDDQEVPVLARVMSATSLRYVGEALTGVLELFRDMLRLVRRKDTVGDREVPS